MQQFRGQIIVAPHTQQVNVLWRSTVHTHVSCKSDFELSFEIASGGNDFLNAVAASCPISTLLLYEVQRRFPTYAVKKKRDN